MERGHVLELNSIYYGNLAAERTHRLSPALCKRAKEASDVVWLTENSATDIESLRTAISAVRTAVAVPLSTPGMNVTVIFFCVRRFEISSAAVDFVVSMARAAAIASVNTFHGDRGDARGEKGEGEGGEELENTLPIGLGREKRMMGRGRGRGRGEGEEGEEGGEEDGGDGGEGLGRSESLREGLGSEDSESDSEGDDVLSVSIGGIGGKAGKTSPRNPGTRPVATTDGVEVAASAASLSLSAAGSPPPPGTSPSSSSSSSPSPPGPSLDLKWSSLQNVEYLTDGGNTWIHTAMISGRPVVVKTLKPECQDVALAINEIEAELDVHRRLRHVHICGFVGAGCTSKGMR